MDMAFYSTYELQVDALKAGRNRYRLELAARLARRAAAVRRHLPRDCDARHRSRSHLLLRGRKGGPVARSPICRDGRSPSARPIHRRPR